MIRRINKWFKSLVLTILPVPYRPEDTLPSIVDNQLSFAHIVDGLNRNEEHPKLFDIIVIGETCGMGMSVRSERRGRVCGKVFIKNVYGGDAKRQYFFAPVQMYDGTSKDVYIGDLRRAEGHKGTWICLS